jgi:hypothetical protein
MKKAILLMVAALVVSSLTGCQCCRDWCGGWFNRGDNCAPPPSACPPGVPRATMMIPSSPQILPSPIEIGPAN